MDNYNYNYNFVRVTRHDSGKINVELCSVHDSMDEVKRAIDKDVFYEHELSNGRLKAERVKGMGRPYQFSTRDDERGCTIERFILSQNGDLFRVSIGDWFYL